MELVITLPVTSREPALTPPLLFKPFVTSKVPRMLKSENVAVPAHFRGLSNVIGFAFATVTSPVNVTTPLEETE